MAPSGKPPPGAADTPFSPLLQSAPCRQLRSAAAGRPCHLVGGALRDCTLGLPPRDFDAVVGGDGAGVARRLSRSLGTRAVELGGDRFAAFRVLAANYAIDIWDRGSLTLEQDLRRRDFTIHSFALDLDSGELLDPFDGLADLAGRVLRATALTGFVEDPLRVLRLCRFMALLDGFRVEDETRSLAARAGVRLVQVAAERKRNELALTLAAPRAQQAARLLVELRLYPELWLGRSHWNHDQRPRPVELAMAFEHLQTTAQRLPRPVDLLIARMALLFASLPEANDHQPVVALETFRRVGLISKASARRVARLLEWRELPRQEGQQRWFLHQLGELWPAAVCYLAARSIAGRQLEASAQTADAVAELAESEFDKIFDPPLLVSGHDLQECLGLEAGARMGRILDALRRRQIEGALATRQQALELAREMAEKAAREE